MVHLRPMTSVPCRILVSCLAAICLLQPSTTLARGNLVQLNTNLEDFRIACTKKLAELYTLRGVYLDSENTTATEGVQVLINEIRGNVFLVNNVLDITFFYNLHKEYDNKNVVAEYMTTRLQEIDENIRYNVHKIDSLAEILNSRKQETLASEFIGHKIQLMDVAESVRMIRDMILEAASTTAPGRIP